jgi:hypothetical protein
MMGSRKGKDAVQPEKTIFTNDNTCHLRMFFFAKVKPRNLD